MTKNKKYTKIKKFTEDRLFETFEERETSKEEHLSKLYLDFAEKFSNPKTSLSELLYIGLNLEKIGDYIAASKLYFKILRTHKSDHPEALLHLSSCMLEINYSPVVALSYINMCISNTSDRSVSSAAFYNKALCFTRLSNFEAAIASLEEAVSISSTFYKAYILMGDIYYNLRDYKAAYDAYSKISHRSEFFKIASYNQAVCLINAGFFDEAIVLIDKNIIFNIGYIGENFLLKAHIFYKKGDYHTALKVFKIACKFKLTFLKPYSKMAEIAIELGDMETASKYLDLSLKQNPDSSEALFLYGYLLTKLEDYNTANYYYDKALEVGGYIPAKILVSKSMCLNLSGNKKEAAKFYRKALEVNSKSDLKIDLSKFFPDDYFSSESDSMDILDKPSEKLNEEERAEIYHVLTTLIDKIERCEKHSDAPISELRDRKNSTSDSIDSAHQTIGTPSSSYSDGEIGSGESSSYKFIGAVSEIFDSV